MPFPSNLEALFAAGYDYLRWENCQACGECVEVYSTPGKRGIVMEPMPSNSSPATRHYETCTPKENNNGAGSNVQTEVRRLSDDRRSSSRAVPRDAVLQQVQHADVPPEGQHQASSAQLKLFGVTDPNHNLLAAGWQDGTLVIQFKTAKWAYAGVPEAEFIKIRRSPFANRIFTSNIKGKFTGTRVD